MLKEFGLWGYRSGDVGTRDRGGTETTTSSACLLGMERTTAIRSPIAYSSFYGGTTRKAHFVHRRREKSLPTTPSRRQTHIGSTVQANGMQISHQFESHVIYL